MKRYLIALLSAFPFYANANVNIASCLENAYPNLISVKNNNIIFRNNTVIPIGTTSNRSFTQILASANVAEQLSQRYPLDFTPPKQYSDPGRIRHDEFFKQIYGASESAIRANLDNVYWKPANKSVSFNRKNGASLQLQKVGEEIAQQPDLINYVNKTLGSFNFRKIAGTHRLSAHSFGIAIDFQLPKHLHKYWRWDGCTTEDKVCPYPVQLMNDNKLQRIVRIFEKHGFIWGGKWASYDSVHFEYRPELLIPQCR
ncbi:hypothetical protein A4G19_09020 [Pasteurellaceae bacterium Macca]|nr:hypothetical protein [Pasteurellaceae bacterium Macca]